MTVEMIIMRSTFPLQVACVLVVTYSMASWSAAG